MNENLPSLLLPLEGRTLLLPSSAIAEIIPFEKPKPIPDIPRWLVGILTWRAIHIPLLYLEKMEPKVVWGEEENKQGETPDPKAHIAILNRATKLQGEGQNLPSNRYPFFSIVLKNVPKLHRLNEGGVKLVSVIEDDPRYLMEVKIQEDYAYIPNLPELWKMIDALPSRLQWFRQLVI